MIDLNSIEYNSTLKEKISGEIILATYSSYDIFKHYIPDIEINKLIKSPLRKEGSPSFGIFKHHSGKLFYKDFGGGSGDCFNFVSKYFEYNNYFKAVCRVGIDFGFNIDYYCPLDYYVDTIKKPKKHKIKILSKEPSTVEIKIKPWTEELLNFWKQYNISLSTLNLFKVAPISDFFINQNRFKADKFSFAYIENKDNKLSMKIYQPYNKQFKFITSHNYSVIDGFANMPKYGELLIITKSKKDIMCLYETANIVAIGPQSETVLMKPQIIDDLKNRFQRIITLFDNDRAGINLKDSYYNAYGIHGILIPEYTKQKDFSDLVKIYKPEESIKILNNLINIKEEEI